MIKYIHLRLWDNSLSESPCPKGGATVAYEFMPDNGPTSVIRYTIALCNDKDHYNKSIGRLIAGGRLAKHKDVMEIPHIEGKKVVEQVIEHLAADV